MAKNIVAIVRAKNKVSDALLEAVPLLYDEHCAERICSMKTWREQILYELLRQSSCRKPKPATKENKG